MNGGHFDSNMAAIKVSEKSKLVFFVSFFELVRPKVSKNV